jgi:hypothetical protein
MRSICIILSFTAILSLAAAGCGPVIDKTAREYLAQYAKLAQEGPWIKTKSGHIVIYTRDPHSSEWSNFAINSNVIKLALVEQNRVMREINEALQTHFQETIKIFIFNKQEGYYRTQGANGAADPIRKVIYFVNWRTNTNKSSFGVLWKHEMVHIIANRGFGRAGTSMFGEGYPVALDGFYTRTYITDDMRGFFSAGNILSPSQLLEPQHQVSDYIYPQSGYLVKWLFNRHGVKKINKLYSYKPEKLKKMFKHVTGESFEDMEKAYLQHCKDTFGPKSTG